MKKKEIWLVVSALVILGLLMGGFGCAAPAPKVEAMKLKAATPYPPPETSLQGYTLKAWEDMVTERTGGAITFENFWGGALGKSSEYPILVKERTVDVSLSSPMYTIGKMPLGDFDYAFPFGPTDSEMVLKARRQIEKEFPEFERDYTGLGLKLLFHVTSGEYDVLSKEPFNTLDDITGVKVGVIGKYFGKWLEAAGAVPVVCPGPERYTALMTGVIDASFHPYVFAWTNKEHEQTKYSTALKLLTTAPFDMWINLELFNELPGDIQDILLEAGEETEKLYATKWMPEWEEMVVKDWKEAGIIFSTLSASEREKWVSRLKDVPAEWAADKEAKGYPGWEIVKRWQEVTADLGFEWMREWGVK